MPKSRHQEDDSVEDGTEYYERVSADNPTGLLALVNEYDEVDCHEDEATVLERYAASQERNCSSTGSCLLGNSVTGFEGSWKTRRYERRAGNTYTRPFRRL
jgi:hypothetical protein